ncbi:MAG TPA: type II toxin-antitoxin system PemK/MazF family toxin [Cyclobacteriaceae bacterium]|nr:type II toxin-antitoxin system PemK/MazF family toxin [Cyclobacteriaceae bacterium]
MEKFVKGDLVVLPFPFSYLSASKKRPALVLADLTGDDVILCQITSQNIKDTYAISLTENEISRGKLIKESNIRPNRLFTADKAIILYKIGAITTEKFKEVRNSIV